MSVQQGADIEAEYFAGETPVLDLLLLLSRSKKRIAQITLASMLVGACIAFTLSPTYTAVAVILPPQAPQSSLNSLMGQLGSLSALGGGGAGSLLKNPSDLYVGILQSRTITDQAIDQFHLQSEWHMQRRDDARKALGAHVQFESAKDGLIVITAKDKSPQQASAFANFYVDALHGMNSKLAITEASQRRLFFDQQLKDEKNALAAAEEDLKVTQQKTGILSLAGQAEQAIRSIAQTRAGIAQREVTLQSLRAYHSDESTDVTMIKRELEALRAQLSELENNQKQLSPGDTQISANQVPSGSLEYARKLREVKYHDTLLSLLARQYEAARIDEAKSAPVIQVVDRAVVPDRKSGPPRLLIILGTGVVGFLVACGWCFWKGAVERARQTPEAAIKLDQLRNQLRWRSS